MSYKHVGPRSVEFSADHQYTSFIWLIRDGALTTFFDHISDPIRIKFTDEARARVRAMTAVHMHPRRRSERCFVIDRTAWWSSTLDTEDTMREFMDNPISSFRTEIAPDIKRWATLIKDHDPEIFKDMSALRLQLPEVIKEEGARIGQEIQDRANYLQELKRQNASRRGMPPYDSGANSVYILIEPLLSAAIEYLTGIWPARPVAPSEGFHLEFEGSKLVRVTQKWLKIESGSDEIFKA